MPSPASANKINLKILNDAGAISTESMTFYKETTVCIILLIPWPLKKKGDRDKMVTQF